MFQLHLVRHHSARLALGLLPLLALPASAATPPVPELRLPEVARPTAMNVDLTLKPEEETFSGKVGIDLELAKPASFLWLNGEGLTVESATVTAGGKTTAATFAPGGDQFLGFDF